MSANPRASQGTDGGESLEPLTIWLTGLSGSGKSTIGRALVERLREASISASMIDGDDLRAERSADLGFSVADRAEQTRRAGEAALAALAAGSVVVVAVIAPVRSARGAVRDRHAPYKFVEVHVATPLEICEQRDPKGLYARARRGEIRDFTGIDSPYEAPEQPDVLIDGGLSVSAAVERIVNYLLFVARP